MLEAPSWGLFFSPIDKIAKIYYNTCMAKKKKPRGNPPKIVGEVITKLEYAFSIGCSDKEACLFAGCAPATLYNYQIKHPDFVERKDLLKKALCLEARQVVADKIKKNKDIDTAKWYCERKMKDEFSNRAEITGAAGEPLTAPTISILPVVPVSADTVEPKPAKK